MENLQLFLNDHDFFLLALSCFRDACHDRIIADYTSVWATFLIK